MRPSFIAYSGDIFFLNKNKYVFRILSFAWYLHLHMNYTPPICTKQEGVTDLWDRQTCFVWFFFLVTPKTSCSDSRWNVFSIWAVTVLLQSSRISEIWEILSVKCISVGIPLPGSVQNVKATAAGKVV